MRTIYLKALIVKKDESFLMIRSKSGWDVPTAVMGSKKSSDTVKDAAKRQCGLIVDVIKPVKLVQLGKDTFAMIFLCRVKSGKIKLEKSRFKWVKPEEEDDYMQVGK